MCYYDTNYEKKTNPESLFFCLSMSRLKLKIKNKKSYIEIKKTKTFTACFILFCGLNLDKEKFTRSENERQESFFFSNF